MAKQEDNFYQKFAQEQQSYQKILVKTQYRSSISSISYEPLENEADIDQKLNNIDIAVHPNLPSLSFVSALDKTTHFKDMMKQRILDSSKLTKKLINVFLTTSNNNIILHDAVDGVLARTIGGEGKPEIFFAPSRTAHFYLVNDAYGFTAGMHALAGHGASLSISYDNQVVLSQRVLQHAFPCATTQFFDAWKNEIDTLKQEKNAIENDNALTLGQ